MAKKGQVEQQWYVVDASDEVLGRLASDIAVVLMGKHRPTYTPHVDCGDFVVVLNAEKVGMTGKKMDDRHYTWYTGYPGLRLESYGDRKERKPEDLIYHAVRRMLPKNKLAYQMIRNSRFTRVLITPTLHNSLKHSSGQARRFRNPKRLSNALPTTHL